MTNCIVINNLQVDQRLKIPLLTRLFVWSIVMEPLLFFKLFERTVTGVTPNVSRLLQTIVLTALLLRLIGSSNCPSRVRLKFCNLVGPFNVNFSRFFLLAIFSGIFGAISGAYSFQNAYLLEDETFFSSILNSSSVRPVFEYIILLYYYAYFVILPQFMLNNEEKLKYFFSVFKKFFIISLVLGVIDVIFAAFDKELIPRHISDWQMVGVRFHGLAGEPRDAFVYLCLGLAILHLYAHYTGSVLNKKLVFAVIFCSLLTQSASGMLGVLFFMVLYLFYAKYSIRKLLQILMMFIIIFAVLYVAVINSERLILYLEALNGLWYILETKGDLPWVMLVQSVNIYPVYDLTVKIRNLDLLPVLIGSGLGSASAITNFYEPKLSGMSNPNSQLIRIIYENGIIGVFLFAMIFTMPVKYLIKNLSSKKQREFLIYSLLLLGAFFAHRSSTAFIYLGVFLTVFRNTRLINPLCRIQ